MEADPSVQAASIRGVQRLLLSERLTQQNCEKQTVNATDISATPQLDANKPCNISAFLSPETHHFQLICPAARTYSQLYAAILKEKPAKLLIGEKQELTNANPANSAARAAQISHFCHV